MDEASQIKLKGILAKEPHELNADEIGFMRARISYVGKNSRAKFAEILQPKETPQPQQEETQSKEEAQPAGEKNNDTAEQPTENTAPFAEQTASVDDDGEVEEPTEDEVDE